MNREQMNDFLFYCWQLNLKTLKDIENFKAQHKATTEKELLNALIKEYNRK